MFKKNDPASFTAYYTLYDGSPADPVATKIGHLVADYTVKKYDDVQVMGPASVNKNGVRKYLLHCTQRIVIASQSEVLPVDAGHFSYDDYPVLLNCQILASSDGASVQVIDYSPQTVNSTVQQSSSQASTDGKTSGTSRSATVGSSSAVTNSYGASVSLEGASAHYEHSSTDTHEQSATSGSENSISSNNEVSGSSSMSVKDWGAYGTVNPLKQMPVWQFGQEYPWNAIECILKDATSAKDKKSRRTHKRIIKDGSKTRLFVPTNMALRLVDNIDPVHYPVFLYPPSQLSLFGINFVTKVQWLVTVNNPQTEELTLDHQLFYSTGSHAYNYDKGAVEVYIDNEPKKLNQGNIQTTLHLGLMSLDVIGSARRSAIVGFSPNQFTIKPAPSGANWGGSPIAPTALKLTSTGNSMLVMDTTSYPLDCTAGAGFTPSETFLLASFTADCPALTLTAYFKVVDTINDYRLYLKHWKTKAPGIKLTFTINNDTANVITKYVDDLEAEGGENNLLSIALRDQNYASVDYHDFLQLGLNKIDITITPLDTQQVSNCGYSIRALSIETVA